MKNLYAAFWKKNAKSFCLSIVLMVTLAVIVTPCQLWAQTPNVSYASQGTYYIGLPVQLSPTASGVAASAYGSGSVAGYITNAYYIAYDQHGGYLYATAFTQYQTQFGLQNGQTLYRVPLGGGTIVAVGSLTNASGVAADKSGNVWVADQIAKAVYKVPYGSNTLTMVASGFNNPQGLAVDASGNVYVADRGNAALEKIPAGGGAWTTAVSGLSGTNNVALDAAGNIFISADGGIYRVPAGGSSASLYISSNEPAGVAIDPSGSVYVADINAQRITKFPPTGSSIVLPVDQASGVAVDQSGNVFSGRWAGGYVTEYKPTGGYYLATPLPPGLSFSSSTGVVSGTPTTVAAAQTYQVYAYNATGGTPTGFGLAIANPPLPVISYTSPQTYPPGVAISPLSPASNYVAPIAYKGSPVTVGSGLVNPVGVATDSQGNVYVSDDAASVNGTSGRVYMEAANGGGQSVLVDGASDPTSVATDAAGDLFISDTGLIQILEVPAGVSYATNESPELSAIGPVAADGAGNVYTFAPGDHTIYKLPSDLSGESPFASGLNSPAGVAADIAGNVYVSDAGNNNIVKFNPDGSSAGVLASVQNPGALTVDAGGNLYVVTTTGNLYTISVGTTTAIQVGSGLTNASSLAIDGKGNIYYTDISNHQLKKISPAGGYFLNTPLPAGLTCSNATGIISGTPAAANAATYSITAYNITGGTSANLSLGIITLTISYNGPDTYSTGAAITPLAPTSTGVAAPGYSNSPVAIGSGFKSPAGVAFDAAGNVYVADENNNAVYKIPAAGGVPVVLGSGFSSPLGVAVDAAGDVFVADANNNAVKEIPVGGGAIITLGSGFKVPASLAVDAAGNVYVADFGNSAIKKIPAGGGATITLATISTNTQGVAVDAAGNVYFATVFGNQVKMIPAGGGALVNLGSGFSQPRGVAVDAAGNVYIADAGNNAIKEIPAGGGAIITLGSGFSGPEDVAIDAAGNIYVADSYNAAVKKIKPVGGYFINPVLPAGLTLDKSTGIISGTPTGFTPAANYTVFAYNSSSSTSAIVNIKTVLPQTITFNALPAKTYGDADFAPGATSTSNVPAITYASDNTAVATIVNGYIHIVGAGTANITASQAAADSSHSAAADVVQPLTVNQAPLTITADTYNMTQGRSVPTLTVTYSGFVNGDSSGSLTTLPSITTTGTSSSPPGTYPITASGAADANYAISYVAGTLNITPPSSVATLGGLVISTGTLSPGFTSATTAYTAAVTNDVTSIAVTPIPNNLNAAITVNGAAVPGATRSGDINLAVGANTITIVVVAEDGVTTLTYTITVTRAASADDSLSALTISNGALSPVFSSGTNSYSVSVFNTVTAMTVTPSTNDPNATVTVDGVAVLSGSASQSLPLVVGANTITIAVTAQDGVTTQPYTLVVTRPKSPNDNLSALKPGTGVISPTFSSATTSYTETVANTVTSITITPTTAASSATVKVNGTGVTSGTASGPIALSVGANVITTVVTAESGAIKTYILTVTRSPSSNANLSTLGQSVSGLTPSFVSGTVSYAINTSNAIATITLKPVSSDAHATITVNGAPVTSGTITAPIALAEGGQTVIATVVTAQDGITAKTYTLTITRSPSSNATLANLQPNNGTLSPAFAAATTSYTASVANAISAITLTPTATDVNAAITVNGIITTSGAASALVPLAEGVQTVITAVVTSQDGTATKTYTLAVTRAPSSDATLSSIKLSNGTLSPAFATATTSYTASVPNSVSTITITPTTTDANATIKVNGTAVTSGTASNPITLTEGGQTVIATVITAQDGTTIQTYTSTITRAPSTNANLSTLGQSVGGLTPAFSAATTSYTENVSNATATITLKPVSSDANATIKVNGATVASGTMTAPIALIEDGKTVITTTVTAQDGTTTKTYSLTVTRAVSTDASLSGIELSNGTLSPAFASATTSYTASVANTVSTITITPTTTDPNATIKVNGTAVTPGNASGAILLAEGVQTVITTVITAQNGTTKETYTVTVTRAPSINANLSTLGQSVGGLTPGFNPATTGYTENVSNATASITLKPVSSDANATIKVNGTAVTSGTTTAPIALAVGANTITTVVTAQNGTTTKTYTLTVNRATGGADSYDQGISVTKPVETPQIADDGIQVHQGVSPNGDGINDFLQIDNISQYPDNKLMIMNRNGQLIYETSGYDNGLKVFNGHSNKNGQMQLPGTYFYQLDYSVNGITKHKTGFIILKY